MYNINDKFGSALINAGENNFQHSLRDGDFFMKYKQLQVSPLAPTPTKNIYKLCNIPENIIKSHEITRLNRQTRHQSIRYTSRKDIEEENKKHIKLQIMNAKCNRIEELTLRKFEEKINKENSMRKNIEEIRQKKVENQMKKDLETNFGFFKQDYNGIV